MRIFTQSLLNCQTQLTQLAQRQRELETYTYNLTEAMNLNTQRLLEHIEELRELVRQNDKYEFG